MYQKGRRAGRLAGVGVPPKITVQLGGGRRSMNTRFEINIPADRRLALDALAAEVDVPIAALIRIGVELVLQRRAVLTLQPPTETPR